MRIFRGNSISPVCLVLASVFGVLVAGCGGGGGGTTPPPIINTSATSPPDFTGGTVTIKATVTDPSSVSVVVAVVTRPDSTQVSVPMTGSTTYTGTYVAPVNNSDSDAVYTVVVNATDKLGNSFSSKPFSFTVPGIGDMPPPPPFIQSP